MTLGATECVAWKMHFIISRNSLASNQNSKFHDKTFQSRTFGRKAIKKKLCENRHTLSTWPNKQWRLGYNLPSSTKKKFLRRDFRHIFFLSQFINSRFSRSFASRIQLVDILTMRVKCACLPSAGCWKLT